MAGAGYKIFEDEDVVFASDLMSYLMDQVVMVFDNATARTTQLASPSEGMLAYTKDDDTLRFFSGAAWLPVANPGTITGVTAGTGLTGGGTSGSVSLSIDGTQNIRTLAAATNGGLTVNQAVGAVEVGITTDAKGDLLVGTGANSVVRLPVGTTNQRLVVNPSTSTGLQWQSESTNTIIDAKGDILVGQSADTLTRLPVGTSGFVLTADSTTATGLAWKDPIQFPVTLITSSASSKTLQLSDANSFLTMTGGNTTVTVPNSSTVDFVIGTQITIQQGASGLTQIAAAAGVTIEVTPGLRLRTLYSVATLIKKASNTWVCFGDLIA